MSMSVKMFSSPLFVCALAIAVPVTGIAVSGSHAVDPCISRQGNVKIGTYDNRAIAIAWAASRHNPVAGKMKEYEAAKKANDKAKVAELEAWGPTHQRLLHFQGFGNVPVGDLLSPVKREIEDLLRDKGLAAITQHCDAFGSEVEIIDVTVDLVRLFEPSERTLEMVDQIRDRQPLSLLELADMDPND